MRYTMQWNRWVMARSGLASCGPGIQLQPGCRVAAIPVALAYVTQVRGRSEAMWLGGLFVLGMIATHALLGLIAGLGGRWVADLMGSG